MTAIALSAITFFSTAFGGMFALRWRKQLYLVMGFSAGILVAAALLDLLPDAFEVVGQSGESTVKQVLQCAAMGFLVYYSLEQFVHRGAAVHEKRQGKAAFASVAAFGLTVHSFLDGFAIGSAFQANSTIGGLVALAVIAHDFGDGVSTVGVVLGSGGALRASIGWLLADAIAPVIGCSAALGMSISQGLIADLLGFFAGSFLFIGAAHLLPEAEEEGNVMWLWLVVVAGFGLMFLVNKLLKV
ncbi:MAG TPA: ZIP family metal transporter [Pirellulales bacterium]|nr:ZIP family metal transporter [Pirellulales bacterium]